MLPDRVSKKKRKRHFVPNTEAGLHQEYALFKPAGFDRMHPTVPDVTPTLFNEAGGASWTMN